MNANDNISPRQRRAPGEETRSAKERACPICGKPRDTRYDPFCSRRCADVDLYRWLKGAYVIAGAGAESKDDEEK